MVLSQRTAGIVHLNVYTLVSCEEGPVPVLRFRSPLPLPFMQKSIKFPQTNQNKLSDIILMPATRSRSDPKRSVQPIIVTITPVDAVSKGRTRSKMIRNRFFHEQRFHLSSCCRIPTAILLVGTLFSRVLA